MAAPPEEAARELVARVRESVARDRLEFSTFLVGLTHEDPELLRDGYLEKWKTEVKRLATRALLEEWPDRAVEPGRPDAAFVFEPRRHRLEVRTAAIFVYGRYRKLSRDLPQTRWFCLSCRGKGCKKCRGRGLGQEECVETLVGDPLAARFRARSEPILHGMGREDRDVRALGTGRPFVIELRNPRARSVDLAAAAAEIEARAAGKVELPIALRVVDGSVVTTLKTLDPAKRYRALALATGDLDPARVEALPARLRGAEISQRTPGRVLRSRADLVRPRRVLELAARLVGPRALELELLAEAGTYVKELVSGDEGRTTPSLAEVLGVAVRVSELDVLEILVSDEEVLRPRETTGSSCPAPPRDPGDPPGSATDGRRSSR